MTTIRTVAIYGGFILLAAMGMSLDPGRVWLVGLYVAAGLPYLLAIRHLQTAEPTRRDLWVAAAVTVAVHGILLAGPLALSDDVYRYMWDARVAQAGVNPYVHAPSDPALMDLRDEYHRLVNHQEVRTIYPPVAQVYFSVADLGRHHPRSFRLAAVACSLAAFLLLGLLLRARGCDPRMAIVLGWSPLVAAETAVGGHVDALALALLIAGLWLAARPVRAGVLLSLSFGAKLGAVALVPFVCKWLGQPRGRALAATFLAVSFLIFSPILGGPILPGLSDFAERWRFNPSLFALIESATLWIVRAPDHQATVIARAVTVAIWLGVAGHLFQRGASPFAAGRSLFGLLLLLSPTVHPWYAMWLLPFLAIRPHWGWLVLTVTVPLSYLGESLPIRLAEYGVPAAVALVALLRGPEKAPLTAADPTI